MTSRDTNTAAPADQDSNTTHFGFETVQKSEKASRVRGVFDSVASKYDIMNDVMSAGVHRIWKDSLIDSLRPKNGERHLDVAGGTGDIAFRAKTKAPGLDVTVCDINAEMLTVGKGRAEDRKFHDIDFVCGNAEVLPFPDQSMDSYTIAFGIRNVTNIDRALKDAHRVLKYGGRFFCLEFSPAVEPALKGMYDRYSFDLIPKFGKMVTGDADSYQYLVESIRRFPTPETFKSMIEDAGFSRAGYRTMSFGVVAIHYGWKI